MTIYYTPEVRRGEYWGVWRIPVAILPSCQDMKTIALPYINMSMNCGPTASSVFLILMILR